MNEPGIGRLTGVELRKMTDTRAGFWLQALVAALTVVATVLYCIFADARDQTFVNLVEVASAPASILLPIVGILLVSSEWSQRTAMTTFALVPKRGRVFGAKLLAGLALAALALVVCFVVAAAGTAFAPDGADTWAMPAGMVGQFALNLAQAMLTGVAFGAVLLASAPAIVAYFALPTASAALGSIPALEGPARWLDGAHTLAPMTAGLMSATEWARVGTTLALWLLLPLLVGLWRVLRADVR